MGRILFLSAVAFAAYRYIARSNQRHLPQGTAKQGAIEVLPPAQKVLSTPARASASVEAAPQTLLVGASAPSRAAESDTVR